MKNSYLLIILLTVPFLSFSQLGKVFGKIVDIENKPLEGVSIVLEGKGKGATSNELGIYTINNIAPGSYKMLVRLIDYSTDTIQINLVAGQSLEQDVKLLRATDFEEVVVIGYQSIRRRNLLASVSSVGAKDLKDIPINSAAEALNGRISRPRGQEELNPANGELRRWAGNVILLLFLLAAVAGVAAACRG